MTTASPEVTRTSSRTKTPTGLDHVQADVLATLESSGFKVDDENTDWLQGQAVALFGTSSNGKGKGKGKSKSSKGYSQLTLEDRRKRLQELKSKSVCRDIEIALAWFYQASHRDDWVAA